MTNAVKKPPQEPQKKPGGSTRRAAIIVGVVCVGVVAAIIAMNMERPAGASPFANAAPVIHGVTSSVERLETLDVCRLVCEATDEDGDSLAYTWTANQGDITGEGATVEWGAPDTEGLFRVTVMVDDGNGGTDEYAISLRVKNNNGPEFRSLSSFSEGVRPGASVSISCTVVDPDGDDLTYEWQATSGEVRGEGDSIEWIAPQEPGSYVVTVTVRDPYGSEATRDVAVSVTSGVKPSTTPKLGKFVVNAINHDLLKYELGVYGIYQGLSCSIECVVVQGDAPYTYEWSADRGTLTADGATAIWEAPESPVSATITVAVTDALGNTNYGQVLMYVEDCTCAFD